MRIALDTNRYTDLARGDADTQRAIQQAQTVFMPLPILGELRGGFLSGSRTAQNEALLVRFLNSPRVSVLIPDEETTHHYARIFHQLRKQGTPIPVNDMWTAALAIQHNLHLFTRDRHFDHLPQLARI